MLFNEALKSTHGQIAHHGARSRNRTGTSLRTRDFLTNYDFRRHS